jgi:hypothetical protein
MEKKMIVRDCKECAFHIITFDESKHWCDKHQLFIRQVKSCCISDLLNKQKRLPSNDCGDIKQGDLFNE